MMVGEAVGIAKTLVVRPLELVLNLDRIAPFGGVEPVLPSWCPVGVDG